MSTDPVPEQTNRTLRVAAEDAFGERLRAHVTRAGARPTDVARWVGIRREDLYEAFDSIRHFRAAWLELLPAAVERIYLEERATAHGLELRVVAASDEPRELSDVVRELAEVMTVAAVSEADGHISVEEAEQELAEWADVERVMTARRERLRMAIAQRGLSVVSRVGR